MKNSNNTITQSGIKKPAPFNAPLSDAPVSRAEIERRERKNRRLKNLGVNPTKIDNDEGGESENPYVVQAMVYIARDEDVPPWLLENIKKYDARHSKAITRVE